jgi:hypothetical protein
MLKMSDIDPRGYFGGYERPGYKTNNSNTNTNVKEKEKQWTT